MAIIIRGSTKCSICEKVINDGDDIVATWRFIQDQGHPLWRFSDSGMHRACFGAWEHRSEYVNLFNDAVGPHVFENWKRHYMSDNGDITSID